MKRQLKIDFVSDISCPWCAIGLKSLEQALERVADDISAELHFQPFELNPQMAPEGQDIHEHLAEKYGLTSEQLEQNRETLSARGREVGVDFQLGQRSRIYNTFDAHRLLHWAYEQGQGRQHLLKHALLRAYFASGENPGSHEVLVRLAGEAGLDTEQARHVLSSGAYAEETRRQERFYLEQGIHSVPSVIINDRYLVQGGQPPEAFEQALRKVAQS